MNKLQLGFDPEIFSETSDNKLMFAFDYLKDKFSPDRTEADQPVYWDGFQAEFNTDPSTDLDECIQSLRLGLKRILQLAQKKNPGARLSTKTVVEVSLATLAALPEDLTEFGCMPSYNVYNIKGKGMPGHEVPYRFAGGHIHFGIGKLPEETMKNIVRFLDAVLGVASVSLFEKLDNPIRREHYGLAGEYRLPPHGLEYRVLSNAWLCHPDIAKKVIICAIDVLAFMNKGGDTSRWQATEQEVIETIVCSDVKMARESLERNKELFAEISPTTYEIFYNSVENIIGNNIDIATNWGF